METKQKEVVRSSFYLLDMQDVFEYGETTFGKKAAIYFFQEIKSIVKKLETEYLLHPECRHLATKTKIYRNIILGSYLIIYRIQTSRIEVLRAFHGSQSPKNIKTVKKIKL